MSAKRHLVNKLATNPETDRRAAASREGLRRALSECHEQLRRAEKLLRRSRQDNSPG